MLSPLDAQYAFLDANHATESLVLQGNSGFCIPPPFRPENLPSQPTQRREEDLAKPPCVPPETESSRKSTGGLRTIQLLWEKSPIGWKADGSVFEASSKSCPFGLNSTLSCQVPLSRPLASPPRDPSTFCPGDFAV